MKQGRTLVPVSFSVYDTVLCGDIQEPGDTPVRGAVVMLPGSGPADRTNFGYFTAIRDDLARRGFAVLCFDKPGTGESGGSWTHQRFPDDLAQVAVAAVDRMRAHLPGTPIGLWGFSEGGWIAPLAASQVDGIAFVVTVSGPYVTPAVQNEHDVATQMCEEGHPEAEIEAGRRYVRDLMQASRAGLAFPTVRDRILTPRGPWSDCFTVDTADDWEYFRRSDCDYDPTDALRSLTCPVLAVFGAADQQVPVPESITAFVRATKRNRRTVLEVFGGADHGIRHDDVLAAGFLDSLAAWMTYTVDDQVAPRLADDAVT